MQKTTNENKINGKLLTPDDVCELLSVSKATIYRIIARREIRFYKIGGGIRFRRDDVEQYMKDNCVESIKGYF